MRSASHAGTTTAAATAAVCIQAADMMAWCKHKGFAATCPALRISSSHDACITVLAITICYQRGIEASTASSSIIAAASCPLVNQGPGGMPFDLRRALFRNVSLPVQSLDAECQ